MEEMPKGKTKGLKAKALRGKDAKLSPAISIADCPEEESIYAD